MIAGGNSHFGAAHLKDELRSIDKKKYVLTNGGASGILQAGQSNTGGTSNILKKTNTSSNNNTKIGFVGAQVVGLTSNNIPYQIPKVRTPTGPTPPNHALTHTKIAGAAEKALLPKMKPRSLNTSFNKGYYHYHASSKDKQHGQSSQQQHTGGKFSGILKEEHLKLVSPTKANPAYARATTNALGGGGNGLMGNKQN